MARRPPRPPGTSSSTSRPSRATAAKAPSTSASPSTPTRRAWSSGSLELVYDPPLVATSATIHEVNSAGAVVELLARPKRGEWVSLWTGEDPTTKPGPFLVTFERTPFAVEGLRVVLDRDRRSGWNEIDAVELSGPTGSAYAAWARASTTYGQ